MTLAINKNFKLLHILKKGSKIKKAIRKNKILNKNTKTKHKNKK